MIPRWLARTCMSTVRVFGHKWAVPVPVETFPRTGDLWGTLEDFMRFCNITNPPMIERGLFT
jgi:hypothetical protein